MVRKSYLTIWLKGEMMKKLLFSLIAFLTIAVSLSAQSNNLLVIAYENNQPLYAPTSKGLWGGNAKFFSASHSYFVDAQIGIAMRRLMEGTEKFQKNKLVLQAEYNYWGPFIAQVSHRSVAEFYEIAAWSDINAPLITENWRNEKLKFGLGAKLGDYRKSFISLAANIGHGWYANRTHLTFLNLNIHRDKFQSTIIGTHLRLRFKPQLQIAKLKLPIWLDLENEYNYWSKSKWHSARTSFSLGIQIFKRFGLEVGTEIVKQAEDRHLKMIDHHLGLAIIF